MRRHFHTSCRRRRDKLICDVLWDSWSSKVRHLQLYFCLILGSVRTLLWPLSEHLKKTFVVRVRTCAHWGQIIFHCDWKKLTFSVCHWSVHLTSHIGHAGRILRGSGLCFTSQGKVPPEIFIPIFFLKSTKCCKLWFCFSSIHIYAL